VKRFLRRFFNGALALRAILLSVYLGYGACASAQLTTPIYVTSLHDELPLYTNVPQGVDSELHMTLFEPASRPRVRPQVKLSSAKQLRSNSSKPRTYVGFPDAVLQQLIENASRMHGVPYALLLAVMQAESSFNPAAVSSVGAVGLMQIMPATGKRYGVHANLFDPQKNIDVGARYLKDLLIIFHGDIELAVAAYNAGEGAVLKYGRKIPPYSETLNYVPKVMKLYASYL
jgi:soluble lytic murein transglycosylase-like protein